MRKLLLLPAALLIAVASCGSSETNDEAARSDSLYHDICRLTKIYADSMAHAADTAAADTLIMNFEAKAAAIYAHYPLGTDQLIGEDRNDTIYMLTKRLIDARQRVLCPPDSVAADSVSRDSVPAPPKPKA